MSFQLFFVDPSHLKAREHKEDPAREFIKSPHMAANGQKDRQHPQYHTDPEDQPFPVQL